MRVLIGLILGATAMVSAADASEFTAVCSDISGVRVDEDTTGLSFDKDAIKGATWTMTFSDHESEVRMIMQNSASSGGRQFTQSGIKISQNPLTWVSVLGGAVWTYSFYTQGKLLVTQHTTGNDDRSLSGKLMTAKCRPG